MNEHVPRVLDVTCGLVERAGRVLIAKRPPGKAQAGKWEFPGGKLEPGEAAPAGLIRELREELGIEVSVESALPPSVHSYGERAIRLLPFRCRIAAGEPHPHEHEELRWCTVEEIGLLDLAEADLPVLAHYRHAIGCPPAIVNH